ncbi:MAG: protein translocase subunit SecD [Coriobacteriaceae bacterium]|nr:protein translocase subunit SecD [Coriobacteriaceae bacterium]
MDPKQQNVLALALVFVLAALAFWLVWPPATKINKGLDIQGGLSVILTAEPQPGKTLTADDMERAETIIQIRVNGLGVSEASVQKQGNDSILVQLPGVKDADSALKALGSTGQLEFVEVASITGSQTIEEGSRLASGTYSAFLRGDVITGANPGTNEQGQIVVNVEMDAEGAKTWGEFTSRLAPTQARVAIVLDGVIQSAPSVRDPILDGRTEISGTFTAEDAKRLATVLESGVLPVKLIFSESRVVGPTLGAQSLRQGLIAGLVGLGVVALYMALFYRGFGVLSWFSLGLFGLIQLGVLALLSQVGVFALSLPGIAGIVLTIGIAADTSVLIFERFKEEVAMGKTFRSAAKSGTRHAIGTSIDADLVTFVSALAIALIAIGPVRGFAFTLLLGIVLDLMVALLFTRTMVIVLAESVIPKYPAFFGVRGGDRDA